jgi:hypothetical protein
MAVSRKFLARLRRPSDSARDLPALRGLDQVDWAAQSEPVDLPGRLSCRCSGGDLPRLNEMRRPGHDGREWRFGKFGRW